MPDDESDYISFDPARLLPFECILEPRGPSVEHLPQGYRSLEARELTERENELPEAVDKQSETE
jgi:hypothetical protein